MNGKTSHNCILFTLSMLTFFVPSMVFAQSVPYAITLGATSITEKSVKANCRISANDTFDTQYWVEWAIANRGIYYETNKISVFGQAVSVSVELFGLAPDLGYNYRCVAENSRGKDFGVTTYVQTKPLSNTQDPVIIVQTLEAIDINETSATLKGYASPHGTNNAERWFEWGTTNSLGNSTYRVSQGWYSGKYEHTITGLQPGTTYYYRAAGKNLSGTTYGAIQIFSTKGKKPSNVSDPTVLSSVDDVKTLGTENIISNAATVGISWSTSEDVSYISIQYGATPEMESELQKILVVGKNQVFHPIISLLPDTKYYYRSVLYGKDGQVKKYGEVKTFVTKQAPGASGISPLGVNPSPTISGGTPGARTGQTNAGNVSGPQLVNPITFFKKFYGLSGNEETKNSPSESATSTQGDQAAKDEKSTNTSGSQIASVGAGSGILGKFWSSVSKGEALSIQTSVDADKKAHETVEYRIRYANESDVAYRNAALKVVYPKNVIYVGDDTSNEFMVEDSAGGPERTYVLSLGDIKPGNKRVITMLGVMTSDTTTDPTPRVRIEYADDTGTIVALKSETVSPSVIAKLEANDIAQVKGATAVGNVTSSGFAFFPTTFISWIVYVVFVIVSVLGYIKGRAYYLKRKKEIQEEERAMAAQTV